MVNILLTAKCNRSCPYCFAEQEMSGQNEDWLSWPDLLYIADFLWSNGRRQVSLLGGEPTIHPQCTDFIRYLLDRGFAVTLFSNGVLSNRRLEECKDYLESAPPDRFNIVCNLNNPTQTPMDATDESRLDKFLSIMGPLVTPGFNIYRHDFDLDFIFGVIARYGMRRDLRLGIAHPVLGASNSHIAPRDIKTVVKRLFSFRPELERYRVRLALDCGFPLCGFSDEELGWFRRWAHPASFDCSPAMDIAPDMSVYYCFPLSRYQRKSLFDFDSIEQIEANFHRINRRIRSEVAGIYAACDGCIQRENAACGGGGLCHIVGRFIDEEPIRLAEIENEIAKFRVSGE